MQQLHRNSRYCSGKVGRLCTATGPADTPHLIISRTRWWFITVFLVVAFARPATASEVAIHVVDQTTGKPVTNAAVCLGTSAESGQFGRVFTSRAGVATFSQVPNTPLLLTVSKPRFKGYERTLNAGDYNRVIQIRLADGVLGPICRITEPPTTPAKTGRTGLHVKRFLINGGKPRTQSRRVTLSSRVSGNPTHYRVSERSDFASANWQPYEKQTVFQLSGPGGRKTIYFQVRRHKEVDGAELQSTSPVLSARISLVSG